MTRLYLFMSAFSPSKGSGTEAGGRSADNPRTRPPVNCIRAPRGRTGRAQSRQPRGRHRRAGGDLGADRRGVDIGPYAVRYARLRESLQALETVMSITAILVRLPGARVGQRARGEAQSFCPIILAVCEQLAQKVPRTGRARRPSFFLLGGDHLNHDRHLQPLHFSLLARLHLDRRARRTSTRR